MIFVYRYNGALPNGDRGRRKSRFALYKRPKANGVKPSTVHVISTPQASKVGGSCTSEGLADSDSRCSLVPPRPFSLLCGTEFPCHLKLDKSWLSRSADLCIVGHVAASLCPLEAGSTSVPPHCQLPPTLQQRKMSLDFTRCPLGGGVSKSVPSPS